MCKNRHRYSQRRATQGIEQRSRGSHPRSDSQLADHIPSVLYAFAAVETGRSFSEAKGIFSIGRNAHFHLRKQSTSDLGKHLGNGMKLTTCINVPRESSSQRIRQQSRVVGAYAPARGRSGPPVCLFAFEVKSRGCRSSSRRRCVTSRAP